MTIKKTALALTALLVLSSVLLTSGCIVAAAGAAGGVLYAKGDLETTLANTPTKIAIATEKAFREMRISKTSAVSSDLDAEIIGRSTTDKRVTVKINAKGEKLSAISIRIGVFGDEDLSRVLFDKIKKNL